LLDYAQGINPKVSFAEFPSHDHSISERLWHFIQRHCFDPGVDVGSQCAESRSFFLGEVRPAVGQSYVLPHLACFRTVKMEEIRVKIWVVYVSHIKDSRR
jgi:hypothetical protein